MDVSLPLCNFLFLTINEIASFPSKNWIENFCFKFYHREIKMLNFDKPVKNMTLHNKFVGDFKSVYHITYVRTQLLFM